MYKIGDLIIVNCLVYEVQSWNSCSECSFGYNDEQECLAPFPNRSILLCGEIQFKFVREATDQECLNHKNWDVIKKSDDEQLIMF